MFIHNINPTLLQLGPLEIRYYGLVYVLGFIATFFYLNYMVNKKKIKLSQDQLHDLLFYLIIGVILGGRLFYILFYNLKYYLSNPLEIFAIWNGGMSFHGALISLVIVLYIFSKKEKIKFYTLADMIVIPAAIFLFFGRIANFINGELYGHITNVSWAVKFQNVPGYRHPSQIYEALKNLAIFFILSSQLNKHRKPGFLFWQFIFFYGLFRFFIEFFRFSPNYYLGLSVGQYLCILMIIPSSYILLKKYLR
jgi:phosphatidylglycerol:prolipoprotein diacylglycerol transferase